MTAFLHSRKNLVLAKVETAPGADAAPTAAADAVEVSDLDLVPYEATEVDRAITRPYLGASPVLNDAVHQTLSCAVELAGSGAAGTAPRYDALLRACGMQATERSGAAGAAASVVVDHITFTAAEAGAAGDSIRIASTTHAADTAAAVTRSQGLVTVTVSISNTSSTQQRRNAVAAAVNALTGADAVVTAAVASGQATTPWTRPTAAQPLSGGRDAVSAATVYAPRSEGFETATLHVNRSGNLHKLTAARGNVSFAVEPGGIPRMNYSLLGRWAAATHQDLPASVDYSAQKLPALPSSGDELTLDGAAVAGASLSLDLGQQAAFLQWLTGDSIEITDRAASGELVLHDPGVAVKDWFEEVVGQRVLDLHYRAGSEAGRIVELDARAQLTQPRYGDREGVQTLTCALRLIPSSAGNDELTLTVR